MTSSEAKFIDSSEHRKGREWEDELKAMFEGEGFTVFRNYELPDLLITKNGRAVWVECKNKARMKMHPATGYPAHQHPKYELCQYLTKMPVFVAFNDNGQQYGSWLNDLNLAIYRQRMVIGDGAVILFKIEPMFPLKNLKSWTNIITPKMEVHSE